MEQDLIVLERLLLENAELDRLESLIAEFNIFETLDIVRAEIRHSNVLAWLLNPNANHGLNDLFLRLFLKYLFSNNREAIKNEVTFFDIEVFNLDDIEIRRESNRIDLLLISEVNKLVIVIENKVDSQEHHDQLNRYFNIISKEFADYRKVFVYLTPESLTPTDEKNWIIFDYPSVFAILSNLIESRKNSLSVSVYDFLNQYCTVLRRYIMPKSEIEDICKKIYLKHQQALDLIFQYRPDIESDVSEIVQEVLKSHNELLLDSAGKTVIRFTTRSLDDLIPREGEGWGGGNRILMFEFNNYLKKLVLRLIIGPGKAEVRVKLHNIARRDNKLFNKSERGLGTKWFTIYQKEFLKSTDYEESDAVQLRELLSKKVNSFMTDDLVRIEKHFTDNWAASASVQ